MISKTRMTAVLLTSGFALGLALSLLGFSDFGEVHKMFTFADLRLFLTFIGAVSLTAVGFALLGRGKFPAAGKVDSNQVLGGMMFGVGWALTGACPTIPLVQIGEGKVWAIVPLAGVVMGILLHNGIKAWHPGWVAPKGLGWKR